jgi:4-amino-4-deoxy-L-arabinose transferase-like glycosyltransferase
MVLWAAIGFVFFSIVSGKRDRYLTPLFPPLAIAVGAWLDGAADALSEWWVRLAARVATGFLVVAALAVGAATLWLLAVTYPFPKPSAAWFVGALTFAGLLGATARKGMLARREGRLPGVAGSVAVGMAILMLAYDVLFVPFIDESKSPRPVAEALNEWPGEVAAYPAHFSGAYNLYSGRLRIPVLKTNEEVLAHLAGPGKRLVLTSVESYGEEDEGSLWQALSRRFRIQDDPLAKEPEAPAAPPVWRNFLGRVGHREMLFLTNYPPP